MNNTITRTRFNFKDASREERIAYFTQLRADATARNARRDSENLDASDCALSYISDGHLSGLNWARLQLVKRDCFYIFDNLYRTDGTLCRTREIKTQFGYRLAVLDEGDKFTGEFLYPAGYYDTPRKVANLRKKGFYFEERIRKAWCKLGGSDILSLYVHHFPTEDDVEGLPVPEGFQFDEFVFDVVPPVIETVDYLAYYK